MKSPVRAVAVLSTPLLMVISFPDFNFPLAAWIALVPFLIVLGTQSLRLRWALSYALVAGTLFFYGSCYWITYSMIHYGGIPPWLAFGLALIPAILLGLFWLPFALGVHWMVARLGPVGLLSAAPLWALTEWGRIECTGMGWNALGYSQAFQPHLIQIASYTGVYGVSFMLAGTAGFLAWAIVVSLKPSRRRPGRRQQMALSVGVASLLLLGIATFLGDETGVMGAKARGDPLRVLGVQPNVPVEVMADSQEMARHFDDLLSLTEQELLSDETIKLVVWPESPLNISLLRSPGVVRALRALVRRSRVYFMLNVVGESRPERYHNSVATFSPAGEVIAEYHKIQLLPFGEYVPLRHQLPFIDKIPALAGDFFPGHEYVVVDIGQARIGSFICSESAIPEIPRHLTQNGATLLVEMTNDAWFGASPVAGQHLAQAIFRAVENRRDIVRVTNSGISVAIAANGTLTGQTRLFEKTARRWVVHSATPSQGMTFYTKYGDLFVGLCAVMGLVFFLLTLPLGIRLDNRQ